MLTCACRDVVCEQGFSNILIGLQKATGITGLQVIPLVDAPEGGVCKP